jgi:hypothetical protein
MGVAVWQGSESADLPPAIEAPEEGPAIEPALGRDDADPEFVCSDMTSLGVGTRIHHDLTLADRGEAQWSAKQK